MFMSIEKILSKRQQITVYDNLKIPNQKEVEDIISKTFKLTASKQNLYPYKVHILGPNHQNYKKLFFDIVKKQKGGTSNVNIVFAPYCLIFTVRFVDNPGPEIYERIKRGHSYLSCDPNRYKGHRQGASLEVGMFAKVLTALVLEKGMDVSYLGCFPDYEKNKDLWKTLPFINDIVIFSMQFGYKNKTHFTAKKKVKKPHINDIINWIKH